MRSEILSNLLYITLGDAGSGILGFVAFAYLARILGPDTLGLIGFGASAAALATPFVDYGLGFIGTREVSRNPSSLTSYIKTILFSRSILLLLAFVGFSVAAWFIISGAKEGRILLLYFLTLLPSVFTLTWAYQALGQTWWFSVEKLTQSILYLVLILLLVHGAENYERIPIAYTVSALVPAFVVLVYYLSKENGPADALDIKKSAGLLKKSFPLFVPTFMSQINIPAALLIVVTFGSLPEAGYFSAASKVIVVSAVIPNLLWSSFYPVLARSAGVDSTENRSLVTRLYRYAVVVGMTPAFFGLMFSRPIVEILFGSAYEGAVVPFQLFSVVASLQFMSVVFTRILPALGKESAFSRLVLSGSVLQIVACLILVPRFGAAGAAWSFIVSETCIAAAALVLVRPLVRGSWLKYPAISLAALSLSYLVVAGVRMTIDLPTIVWISAVAVLYGTVLVSTSTVSPRDFRPHEPAPR